MTVTVTQENYIKYLAQAIKIANSNDISPSHLEMVSSSVKQTEFLVPIIGGFSAGKSTLINGLLGKDILPVGISPETELAAEIRYSEKESIEAIKKDGTAVLFPIDGFDSIKKSSGEYTHLRVNVNASPLKVIQPAVLVDMPGFGSSIGAHAEALAYYMSKGAFYIAAISADEGAIPTSMFTELSEVSSLGRSVGYLLTKCNLRAKQDIADVCDHIATSVHVEMQQEVTVFQCGFEAKGLIDLLGGLDKNTLARELFSNQMEDAHIRILEALQIRASAMSKSLQERHEAKVSLENTLKLLNTQKNRKIEEIGSASSDLITRLCLKKVQEQLEDATPELVVKIKNNDKNGVEQTVFSIVRSSLTSVMRRQMAQYSNELIDDFGKELQSLDTQFDELDSGEWVSNIVNTLKTRMSEMESQLVKLKDGMDKAGKGYKVLTTILAVCSSVVMPVIELVIIFLPEILSIITKGKIEEKIKSGIESEMIPQIKAKLQEVIPSIIEEQMRSMVESTVHEFEIRIEEKKAALESMEGGGVG